MAAASYCPHCGAVNPPEETTCFACMRSLAPSPGTGAELGLQRVLRGRYRLRRQIRTGGFGAVYQAEDTQLGQRVVAVKEMSPRGLVPEEAREATEGFRREALLLAGLSHPNLPRIHEYFEESGCWYLVMEFIEGQTLEYYLAQRGGSLPVKEALQIVLYLCSVLGYLHSRQPPIVFRDLKPANVMRTPEGQLFLIDFGIARLFKPGQAKDTMAFGSPGYAAPEQYGKAQTTPRSDVFSLGALLHQLLTGIDPSETPFRFKPLTMPRPAGLSSLIERMVDLDADRRPATIELVREQLSWMLTDTMPWSTQENQGMHPLPSPGAQGHQTNASPIPSPASLSWQSQHAHPVTPAAPGVSRLPVKKKTHWGRWMALALVVCTFCACCGGLSYWHGLAPSPQGVAGTGSEGNPTLHTITPVPSEIVPVYALAWSPDGAILAYGGASGLVELQQMPSGQHTMVKTDMAQVTTLAWSPDGAYLAAGGDAGKISIVRAGGSVATRYAVEASNINALSWSADNRRIAVAANDGTVRIVDALLGVIGTTFVTGQEPVAEVAWSPDDRYIAFGLSDAWVHVRESATGKAVYDYHDDQSGVEVFAWSPESARIASADAYGQVQIWDASTGGHRSTYAPVGTVIDVTNGVNALGWAPNGHYLASGGEQDTVTVWASGETTPRFTYRRHSGRIRAVVWSETGDHIASASDDGTVQVWNALTGDHEQTYRLHRGDNT